MKALVAGLFAALLALSLAAPADACPYGSSESKDKASSVGA